MFVTQVHEVQTELIVCCLLVNNAIFEHNFSVHRKRREVQTLYANSVWYIALDAHLSSPPNKEGNVFTFVGLSVDKITQTVVDQFVL